MAWVRRAAGANDRRRRLRTLGHETRQQCTVYYSHFNETVGDLNADLLHCGQASREYGVSRKHHLIPSLWVGRTQPCHDATKLRPPTSSDNLKRRLQHSIVNICVATVIIRRSQIARYVWQFLCRNLGLLDHASLLLFFFYK